MFRSVLIGILFLTLCLPILANENPEILPLRNIKAGMKAKAKTVFEGFNAEEFDLEIIGVLQNAIGTGQHIILAKLIGDKVAFSGVVAGMSGSPVYIDDRLIGAIAYRFGIFQKEPIAGITPIENMLEVGKYSGSIVSSIGYETEHDSDSLLHKMKPIATPLIFGGFHQSVFHHYSSYFEDLGFLPLQGGGSSHRENKTGPFEPGAAVAAVLVSGDMDIAAIGTLTYRSGNKVLAFGHPFLMSGPVEIPMAKAEILHTISSSMASFKMSNTADTVGAILQDRLTGVEGQIGMKPRMIPIKVTANSDSGHSKDFHYEIIKHRNLSPTLLSLAISNSLVNTLFYSENISVFAKLNISIEKCESLNLEKFYSIEQDLSKLPFFLSRDISLIYSKILNNRFETPIVQKIEVSLDIKEGIRSASLERVWYEKNRAKKGDKINIKAYLKSFRGEIIEENFEMVIPSDTKHRRIKVTLGDPIAIDHLRGKIFQKKLEQVKNLNDYIRILNEQPVNHQMILMISEPSIGAIVEGTLLTNLPPSIASVFQSQRGEKPISRMDENVFYETVHQMDFIISGIRAFYIDIE